MGCLLLSLLMLAVWSPLVWADITSNLVSWWKFDDATGTSATDSGTNGRTGTLTNGPTWQTSANCQVNGCLAFDGVDDHVTLASNPLATMAAAHSVCAWLKFTDNTVADGGGINQTALNFFTDASNGMRLQIEAAIPGGIVVSLTAGGTTFGQAASTTTFPSNTWTHVCYTFNGSTVVVYAGGSVVTTAGSATTIGTANTMGARTSGVGQMGGAMDDVRVYTRVLSASDVLELLAVGRTKRRPLWLN